MRRYLPLLLIAFFLIVAAAAGTVFLAGNAGEQVPENRKSVVLYTTIPIEQAALLGEQFEQETAIAVNIVPLSPADLITKLSSEATAPQADLILTDQTTMVDLGKAKLLQPYTSEQVDIIPPLYCDDNSLWTGVWYDPIIFAANLDFLKRQPQEPVAWADLVKPNNYRLVVADFLATDASANLLFTLAAVNGEEETLDYLQKLHPKIIQYAKFLATPPRMVGMGEADIGIAVQSETLRYVKDKFPIKVIYPAEGTAYLLTAAGLTAGAPHSEEGKKLLDWLLQDAAQNLLDKNRFYFIPTNRETAVYKARNPKALKLLEYDAPLAPQQKTKLLDKWVQTVRMSPR